MKHIELDPHGSHVAPTNEHPRNLGEVYLSVLSFDFEHGDRGWKALDEQNVIETPNGGFEIFKENYNYDAPCPP
jgi:hypothetical protein